MTTRRLYYDDARLREFRATVVERQLTHAGPAVRLDQTAFYPTSGGQPHDTGFLNGIAVTDVWDDDQGEIWHTLAAPLAGEDVLGIIDWERRFDHMQQHTGQHLLSAAFLEGMNAATVGFHLGSDASTIDLDIAHLDWAAAHRMENAVNRVIWENRPVGIHHVDPSRLAGFPLRKPPQVEGTVRVIWVEGYDASACGGTHVAMTGEIGLLKVTSIERYKGGVRVGFLCGARALHAYQATLRVLQDACAQLSVGQSEVLDALERIQEESKTLRRANARLQGEMALLEADRLWMNTPEQHGIRWVVGHWTDKSFAEVRAMTAHLRERAHTVSLLAATESGGVRLVCGRSPDLDAVDAAELLRLSLSALQGRGGGSRELAQGGAPERPPEAVIRALQDAVAHLSKEIQPPT